MPGRSGVNVRVVGQVLVACRKSWPDIQGGDSGTESAVSQFNMYLLRRQTVFLEVWLPFVLSEPETLGALLYISTFGSLVQKKGNTGQADQLPAILVEIVLVPLDFKI